MRKIILVFVACIVVGASIARSSEPGAGHRTSPAITPCAPGVVYVQLREGSSVLGRRNQKGEIIQSAGGTPFNRVLAQLQMRTIVQFDAAAPKDSITHLLGVDRMYCIYYSNQSIDAHAAIEMLESTGEVECGSVRYLFPVSKTTNDPEEANQYALTNMSVFGAWDVTTGDTNIVIADVDVGFNLAHEDLKNAFKVNWGESGKDAQGRDKRSNGVDDDGDGYIDNWRGWDVVGAVNSSTGQQFMPDNDPSPEDAGASHGTVTAGCIAASGNNHLGIAGVAFGCRFMPVKAAGTDYATTVSGGYEGIHYASTHGARIISCSWGGPVAGSDLTFFNTILQEAIDRNALVVVAAGNDLRNNDITPYYPCSGPGVLSVGATDQSDAAANFSNYGHTINVYAPGVQILSTGWPGGLPISNNSYVAEDGTSFACPLTAGVAALVATLHPNWPPRFIARQIIQTCDNVVNVNDQYDYWGRVNAQAAVGAPVGPGLQVTAYWLDGVASDSLGAVGAFADLKVTFKNFVAAGSNLTAKLLTRTGYTTVSPAVSLGSLATDATVQGDFQIARTGVYSEGRMPIRFAVTDGASYDDTLELLLPLRKVPGFVVERLARFGQSVKRVSNTSAWAAAGFQPTSGQATAIFYRERAGVWADSAVLGDGLAAPYDVEALDSLTAYFGTGPTNGAAAVVYTLDGGKNFTSAFVSSFTPFVNTIHFFDTKNGILIGDPPKGTSSVLPWGIGITSDGGNTWQQINGVPNNSVAGEASWNNSASWVGDNGWFGSNSSRIWRSINRGQTWTPSAKLTYQNCLSLAFDDDALHGIACFRPVSSTTGSVTGKKALMLSTDGGQTWKFLKSPVPGLTPGSIRFVPGMHTAVLASDSGIYRTADYGATWTPIGIPVSYSGLDGDLSVFSNVVGTMSVSCLSNSNGIATYYESPQTTPRGVTVTPLSANSIDFGTVTVGGSKTVTITLTNNGTLPVTIDSVKIKPAASVFVSSSTNLPKTLASGESMTMDITFRPTASGGQGANLVVSQSGSVIVQVPIVGVGQSQDGVADVNSVGDVQFVIASNPVHGMTQFRFELPSHQMIRLGVYDALGREVAALVNGMLTEGSHEVTFDGRALASGVYYATLVTETGLRLTRAVTLLP